VAGSRIVTLPNAISVVRLACAPLLLWLLLGPDERWVAVALLATLGATDWVDGWIARRFDQGSDLGKVLDPVADRVLLLAAAFGLLLEGSVPVAVAAAVLAREALVAIAVLALAALGAARIDVQWTGKAGTLALMFALPGFLIAAAMAGGEGRDAVLGLAWVFTAGGLLLGYQALGAYAPLARAALHDGRAARADRVAA
jgi:cardiolipin synthase (CMP-forming)